MEFPIPVLWQNVQGQNRNSAFRLNLLLVFCLALILPARAQTLLTPRQAQSANLIFENRTHGGRLACTIERWMPTMDFMFRFDAGFAVRFPMKQFERKETTMAIIVRVTPEGGTPVFLGESCRLPAIPPPGNPGKTVIECSGGFSVGEGKFRVEVVATDDRGRACQRQWNITVARGHNQREAPEVVPAHTVQPFQIRPWTSKLEPGGTGIRLTVLLDAAPINPRSLKLRRWDREFLLQSLTSLLQQIPSEPVRLIAFNLDQQREIFRQEHFDISGFRQLSQALGNLELGIPASTLQHRQGWADLLAGLSNQEVNAHDPVDAVIFLGPATFYAHKVPPELLRPRETSNPHFFYFEYYPFWRNGNEFPDTIEYLTRTRQGTVFKIHSPGDLASSIHKMLKQLRPDGERATPGS